jgi:alanine-glyoxylate transaminase / (R)-3-amino-2-methylpropionate-pyruvate transaminase
MSVSCTLESSLVHRAIMIAHFGPFHLSVHLQVCYFVNSGSEANDLALLMARVYTGNKDIVCLRNCYHGISLGTMPACGHSTWRHDVGTSGMLHAMNPDPYRGAFGADSAAYAKDLQDLVRSGSSGRLAGFLAETIQGVGGAVPLADGYLSKAYEVLYSLFVLFVRCLGGS